MFRFWLALRSGGDFGTRGRGHFRLRSGGGRLIRNRGSFHNCGGNGFDGGGCRGRRHFGLRLGSRRGGHGHARIGEQCGLGRLIALRLGRDIGRGVLGDSGRAGRIDLAAEREQMRPAAQTLAAVRVGGHAFEQHEDGLAHAGLVPFQPLAEREGGAFLALAGLGIDPVRNLEVGEGELFRARERGVVHRTARVVVLGSVGLAALAGLAVFLAFAHMFVFVLFTNCADILTLPYTRVKGIVKLFSEGDS